VGDVWRGARSHAWAGHSLEVLMRVYAKCMTGLEDVWTSRMNEGLHATEPRHGDEAEDTAGDDGEARDDQGTSWDAEAVRFWLLLPRRGLQRQARSWP
jgi:hypothetical protein